VANILVHIHSGPDQPVKATLGCLVALTAAHEGHDVTVFLAGDGVHCLAPAHADVTGAGTGRLRDHLDGFRRQGVTVIASGLSSKARGYDAALIAPFDGSFGTPDRLVALSVAADTVLCY
jgi:uncharacterized protein